MSVDIISESRKAVKYWWLSIIIGIVSIALGVWFMAKPIEGLVALSILFVAAFLATGISEIAFALSNKSSMRNWGWILTNGIISLVIGLILLFPLGTAEAPFVMIYFVGFWIMFQSIWAIGLALDFQALRVSGWGWLLALAVLGVIFSLLFIVSPMFGGAFIVMLASLAFILYGLFRLGIGIKMKSVEDALNA